MLLVLCKKKKGGYADADVCIRIQQTHLAVRVWHRVRLHQFN